MDKLPLTSNDVLVERILRIREEFPEVFSEGKIDFERLKMALGEFVDNGRERYGLTWAGKSEAIRNIQTPSIGTLLPVPEESVNFETSENLIIEGDNLEVLKLLQKSYHGKIKMIYIDPPYNTGNEFIYPDNFHEGLEDYLRYSGQVDEDGIRLSTNAETDGRFHSKWLNMMYPRLFLARNLLREDGVMFVSIDDNEVKNLRALMDEIYGEENFIANIVWQKKQSPQNDATYFSAMHDHILVYAKRAKTSRVDSFGWERNLLERGAEQDKRYTNPDNDPRGDWTSVDYTCNKTADERPNLYYPIRNPFTGEDVWPSRQRVWRFEKSTHQKNEAENRISWGASGTNFPRLKRFKSEVQAGIVPSTWWDRDEAGDNQQARRELRSIFSEDEDNFSTPKPTKLIERMLKIATESTGEDIILDFFAGSGTTAHAVMNLNSEDGGNRRFILVQLPEIIERGHFATVSEITKERVRRVVQKFPGDARDVGFKVFRLASSNFKAWRPDPSSGNARQLAEQLRLFSDNVLQGRSQQDVMYEILLKSGLSLDARIEVVKFGEQVGFSIAGGALIICLGDQIDLDTFTHIVHSSPRSVVCLDIAFHGNDNLKTNVKLLMESHEIEFHTV